MSGMSKDDRVPVVMGVAAGPGDLVMRLPPAAHSFGCACCGGRDPLAAELAAAYVARNRGTRPWFDRVVVMGAADQAARVAAVLAADPVALARFRPEPE